MIYEYLPGFVEDGNQRLMNMEMHEQPRSKVAGSCSVGGMEN
jgi:hypothetical protein